MKIALVHMRHATTGGTERFLNSLSRYLAEKGEDVTIICRSHAAPSHPSIKFVTLHALGFGKAHRMWQFAKAVEKHLKEREYDFVYGLGKTWSHDMLRIGGGTHHHYLQTIGYQRLRLKDRVALAIERKGMAPGAYQHIIANSFKSAQEIRQAYHIPDERVSVIHNFVDTQRFDRTRCLEAASHIAKTLCLNTDIPTFLFLGTGYARKGLEPTLIAFSKLTFRANLVVVGRDSQEATYRKQAEHFGIAEYCYFMGEQAYPEHYFSLADCYLLPAYYEPFGFTAIEALSCGVPVITTENCGAKEVLKENISTVVSRYVDPADIAQAMTCWATKRKDNNVRRRCRELALTLDEKSIMEENYQKILSVYRMKEGLDSQ